MSKLISFVMHGLVNHPSSDTLVSLVNLLSDQPATVFDYDLALANWYEYVIHELFQWPSQAVLSNPNPLFREAFYIASTQLYPTLQPIFEGSNYRGIAGINVDLTTIPSACKIDMVLW